MSRSKVSLTVAASILVISFLAIGAFLVHANTESYTWKFAFANPQQAMAHFYAYGHGGPYRPGPAEDMLYDPLILSGRRVVPLVVAAVKGKNMPKRRYALAFLGNGRYRQALSVLEGILADPDEKPLIRAVALKAICKIDHDLGMIRARTYASMASGTEEDFLGSSAQDLLNGRYDLRRRRTYLQAFFSWHD